MLRTGTPAKLTPRGLSLAWEAGVLGAIVLVASPRHPVTGDKTLVCPGCTFGLALQIPPFSGVLV